MKRQTQSKTGIRRSQILMLGLFLLISLGFVGITQANSITIKGVPLKIALEVFSDSQAMQAYFQDDKPGLHERLQQLGVEEEVKAFYRPKFQDEVALDQYIHQVFYDLTGYVGQAYEVNPQGKLVLINPVQRDQAYHRWVELALKVGVIVGTAQENNIQYVIAPDGTKIAYTEAVWLFPLPQLKRLAQFS